MGIEISETAMFEVTLDTSKITLPREATQDDELLAVLLWLDRQRLRSVAQSGWHRAMNSAFRHAVQDAGGQIITQESRRSQ